jgi:hypothetical protein
MKSTLDVKTVCIWGYIAGALQAESKALGHVLRTSPSEQEPRARLIHLPCGASKASTSFAASLLTIGPNDDSIATADGGDERHLTLRSRQTALRDHERQAIHLESSYARKYGPACQTDVWKMELTANSG